MSLSIAQAIALASPVLGDLKKALVAAREALLRAKASLPDLASTFDERIAELDSKIAALDAVADPAALGNLGVAVVQELMHPSRFTADPRFHPGDFGG